MTAPIVIHGFATSNNFKVLVALTYKQLPFEYRRIDPADREALRAISGQILTPVMQHRLAAGGEAVLFDSAAIMRYLDANFPDTPRLYGSDRASTWGIERWERVARGRLAEPMMEVVTLRLAGEDVPDALRDDASARFAAVAGEIGAALDGRQWLVGDAMTAADIATGCVLHRIRVSGLLAWSPPLEALTPWIDRVVAHLPEGAAD